MMVDVFTKAKRHEIMASVKSRDTKPEKAVRSIIHRMGFRFSLHRRDLPGKPDIVLPRHGKVIFVHGCFWHGHTNCRKATIPATNTEFWAEKIAKNKTRDTKVKRQLKKAGWKVLAVWECEIAKPNKLLRKLKKFLEPHNER